MVFLILHFHREKGADGVNEDEIPICKDDILVESGYRVKTLPWST